MLEKSKNKKLKLRLEKVTDALNVAKAGLTEKDAEIASLKKQLASIDKSAEDLEHEILKIKEARENYNRLIKDVKIIVKELKRGNGGWKNDGN